LPRLPDASGPLFRVHLFRSSPGFSFGTRADGYCPLSLPPLPLRYSARSETVSSPATALPFFRKIALLTSVSLSRSFFWLCACSLPRASPWVRVDRRIRRAFRSASSSGEHGLVLTHGLFRISTGIDRLFENVPLVTTGMGDPIRRHWLWRLYAVAVVPLPFNIAHGRSSRIVACDHGRSKLSRNVHIGLD